MLAPITAGYLFQADWGLQAVALTMGVGSLLAAVVVAMLRVPPRQLGRGQMIVTLEFSAGLAVISVDNPPVNTINAATRAELFAALAQIRARPDLRGVVLLCAGSTFFSGADISEFAGPPKEEEYRALFAELEALPVPVVAAMHGTVLGGGLELASRATIAWRAGHPFRPAGSDAGHHPRRGWHATHAAAHRRREHARADPRRATGTCAR